MKKHKIKPKTDKYMEPSAVGLSKKESKPSFPTVRFQLEHLPEAKDCKIGDMCTVEVTGKVVALSQSRFDNSVEIEMHEVGMEDAGTEDKEDAGEKD